MNRCKKCYMPDTRPGTKFVDGVCQACLNYESMKTVDWEQRKKDFWILCNKYRKHTGGYDCVIPVSGGKDSYALVYYLRKEIGMNPLLVTVADPFTKTKAGIHNISNLRDVFNCDHFVFNIGTTTFRNATRKAFERTGEPLKFVETAIYTVPFKLMIAMDIPFMVYGEDSRFIYGSSDKESRFANDAIMDVFDGFDRSFWISEGLDQEMLNCCMKPDKSDIVRVDPCVLFLSYYIPWDCMSNLRIARRFGFLDLYHEWQREGYSDNYQQIDSIAYMIHHWMKYPKFGFNRPMDIAGRDCREGRIGIDEVKRLTEDQWKVDQRALVDFCSFCGYTIKEFWDIVEMHWNHGIKDFNFFKYYEHEQMGSLKKMDSA